ncbi:MAG: OsmC family protein [Acidobacteriota bacterium]|jgi:putative redox protein
MASANTMTVQLDWRGDQLFQGSVGDTPVAVDGKAASAASPVQQLATGLAGCMAIDVVHILGRMRTPPVEMSIELTIERASSDPRRVLRADMKFVVVGDVPDKNIQRALDMSRETYCSVWHSLRRDIELKTGFEVRPL